MTQIKIFHTHDNLESVEREVNEFIKDKEVIDIKTTSTLSVDDEIPFWGFEVTVIYKV